MTASHNSDKADINQLKSSSTLLFKITSKRQEANLCQIRNTHLAVCKHSEDVQISIRSKTETFFVTRYNSSNKCSVS